MLDMKRFLSYLLVLLCISGTAFAQIGEIYGTITDETNQPFYAGGVTIIVTQGGLSKGGAVTNDDGSYSVKPLQPGSYDVEFRGMGYSTIRITGVTVSAGGSTKLNQKMQKQDATQLTEVKIITKRYPKPLINKVQVTTSEEIERMPTRSTNDIASQSTQVYQSRNGAGLNIGGARTDGTVYVLDGMVLNSGSVNLAQGTIGQLQVIASGVPANYGDATGGIVAMTSKGISNKLHGGVQAQHSVDGYNQNLVNAYATGPLLSKMKDGVKKPILGFMAGADFGYDADADPTYIKNPVLKKSVLDQLKANPLKFVNTTNGPILQSSSQYVTSSDFEKQKQQLNNSQTYIRFNGKLDYALNDNINITLGGTFGYNKSQGYNREYSYFSPDGLNDNLSYTGRGYVRFTQRFGQQNASTDNKAIVSNAFYTVQADYSNTYNSSENKDLGRNIFKYGYVGKFTQTRTPIYTSGTDSITGKQGIILQSLDYLTNINFEASDLNPVLANYTKTVYGIYGNTGALTQSAAVQNLGGLMNGDFPALAMSTNGQRMFSIGAGSTGYNYNNSEQVGVHIDASFDFKPKKTVHSIQFGLYYEQRTTRAFSVTSNLNGYGTNSIWNLMTQLSNRHIAGLDYNNPIFIHNGVRYTKEEVAAGSFFLPTDTVLYNRLNTNGNNGYNGTQSAFDRNLRKKLGLNPDGTDYIDVQSLDPNKLSLDLFSADELLNQGNNFVSYYGYDHTGKKISGQVNFNDFFTAKDANGVYTRPIGAFHPNYIAGYIMDKFRFKDMNFNIGVRVDRYDASTKVLKDPYSLYELQTRGKVDGSYNTANGKKHPDNIGSGYAVYVNNNLSASPVIAGYRNGDTWYDPFGKVIADPSQLSTLYAGGSPIQPYLTPEGKVKITESGYDPNRSFTDYKPQVNVMPRFQFDFPIADAALFYAHYDILVQRPKTGNFATPVDYYYLAQNQSQIIGNPDLKPEKTFDYELGFQQALSKSTAITISAFYKERKDMIQVRPYLNAWPKTYYTYGNRDFSTTKGFAFKYDYRRRNSLPIEFTLNYTLQFAEGTGSTASSSNGGNGSIVSSSGLLQNFITASLPNLRFVSALDYDSRHNIALNFDYRYRENEGPMVGGKKVFENMGANMIFRARSGEPYTTYANVIGNTIEGGLNGTRKPWHFGIDLRIDKTFMINGFKKKSVEGAPSTSTQYGLTAFVYFQNLFNIRDVLGVYAYTGRPDDDGYLTSPTGQQYFNTQLSPQSLQDLYSLYVNNPDNYNGPRRINIGFLFSF